MEFVVGRAQNYAPLEKVDISIPSSGGSSQNRQNNMTESANNVISLILLVVTEMRQREDHQWYRA